MGDKDNSSDTLYQRYLTFSACTVGLNGKWWQGILNKAHCSWRNKSVSKKQQKEKTQKR